MYVFAEYQLLCLHSFPVGSELNIFQVVLIAVIFMSAALIPEDRNASMHIQMM